MQLEYRIQHTQATLEYLLETSMVHGIWLEEGIQYQIGPMLEASRTTCPKFIHCISVCGTAATLVQFELRNS